MLCVFCLDIGFLWVLSEVNTQNYFWYGPWDHLTSATLLDARK